MDLKKYKQIWKDFYDVMIAEQRKKEPRESLSSVEKKLKTSGKL